VKLKKQLGLLGVFSIASGAMISSGLFVLPGIVYASVGPAVILAYIMAGLLILPAMFAKAELATAMPRAGGSYYFVERSMGSVAGTIGGFASWFSLSLKSAFALVGIGAFATLIAPGIPIWHIKLVAVGFCVFFTVLNLVSVKFTGRVQVFLVLVLIGLLIVYIVRGAMSLEVHRYTPFMPFGADAMFAAAGMVFISFGGLTKITSVSEEVKNPSRNIPLGMILSFCIILVIYGLGVFVTVGLLEGQELAGSLTPISTAGKKIFGTFGTVVMAVAAVLAFISTANAGILSSSRFPTAMSRDQLLPQFFCRVNKRFKTPHFSVIATGAFMVAVVLFLDLENLVKVASAMKILLFMFMLLACITMRESKILNYKPTFPSPLYPWLPVAGLICYGFFLYKMGTVSLLATGGFIIASIVWHRVYVRKRATRKSALVHVVERIISKEIAGDSLVSELREVLEERDELIEDRFGRLVRNCEIIDLDEQTPLGEFFTIVAEKLALRLGIDTKRILDSFITRENESTTVLRPGLAIPHITIDGDHKFDLVIARCEAGILFEEDAEPVYAAFILVGTSDERNFHLRALSAIAQIVQDPDFDKNWLRARSIEQLRDIVSLAKRHRHGS
jgi:amino acid transporter/mannitol/fructose-specific phosphotransferase system IIA component (Ntr-type)